MHRQMMMRHHLVVSLSLSLRSWMYECPNAVSLSVVIYRVSLAGTFHIQGLSNLYFFLLVFIESI